VPGVEVALHASPALIAMLALFVCAAPGALWLALRPAMGAGLAGALAMLGAALLAMRAVRALRRIPVGVTLPAAGRAVAAGPDVALRWRDARVRRVSLAGVSRLAGAAIFLTCVDAAGRRFHVAVAADATTADAFRALLVDARQRLRCVDPALRGARPP
jgi:hypothetical protein